MNTQIKHDPFPGASAASAFAGFGRFGSRIAFAPEGGAGDGGAAGGEGNKGGEGGAPADEGNKGGEGAGAAGGAGGAAGDGNKPSDAEAKLIKDLGKAKDKLKLFEGIDPEEYKALKAAKIANDAKAAEDERKAAEARGDFERVKASMVEQHNAEKATLQGQIDALTADKAKLSGTIDELTIGSSFLNSKFVAEDLILTPAKARVVYGAHFTQENGVIVAYDKPAGAAERTKLVDAQGQAVGFEDALKRLVAADPDKDRLLRSKMSNGSGSSTNKAPTTDTSGDDLKGLSRIKAALAKKAA